MRIRQSRRDFLANALLVAAGGVFGAGESLAAEGPPETTTIRLARTPAICLAPVYIAEDLLRAEGFSDIRSVPSAPAMVGRGEIDFDFQFGAWIASELDAGAPVTALAGVHAGCHEVFAHEPIRTIGDLKGKRVGVRRLGAGDHLNLALMAAKVGLDPQKNIDWVTSAGNPMALFTAREVDAFLGSPPEPQELRARQIGRVILNIATDKPWSQYFCCMVFGNREFIRDHPVATKRFLRAMLKAIDVCAADPKEAAQRMVDAGVTPRYDYALQTLSEIPYGAWREFDPEDTMRFYALRLHEVGMIQSSRAPRRGHRLALRQRAQARAEGVRQRRRAEQVCPAVEVAERRLPMQIRQNRRDFLVSASLAGTAGLLGARTALADEAPPETTAVRIASYPNICTAPGFIAEDLLRAEGFTDIRFVPKLTVDAVARGEIDFDFETAAWIVSQADAGEPITALAGVHPGCYELFAHESIRTISDLKGKRVGISMIGSSGHLLLAIMAAHVGLDPHQDIAWITSREGNFMALFAEGQVDAFLAFPPEPQELRARKLGRMILSLGTDQPWSQYFCCIAFGNSEFVRNHPIATKRFLRAILKAADICANDPQTAAQQLVDDGYTARYDYALQTLTDLRYASWREFDPEDSLRFYALRLHEVGMISSSPNKILAEGTDWRFLDELKRELKA